MKRTFPALGSLLLCVSLIGCSSEPTEPPAAAAAQPELIDRQVLFGNPERFQGRLSPDGEMMSFRAPLNGVMNLWVAKRGDFASARAITEDTGRGIPSHGWALDSEHVIYSQDIGGDENWHLYSVALTSGDVVDLTPYAGISAQLVAQSSQVPGMVAVGINDRDPKWHDLYLVDLASGERTLLARNDGFASLHVDNSLTVRLATRSEADGGATVLKALGDQWQPLLTIPFEDILLTGILGFDQDNQGFYMVDSRGRDKAALVYVDLESGDSRVLASSERVDVSNVLLHPQTHQPIAYAEDYHRPRYQAVDPQYQASIDQLNAQLSGGASVLAQTQDNRYWTLYTDDSNRSPVYKVFDLESGQLSELFVTQPALEGLNLAKMQGVTIPSRDGLELVSYLTLPSGSDGNGDGRPEQALPMVLLVHGGPWARDVFGYSPMVQWLANRGYAVLQVNFRASTGFGKAFVNAGNGEWGRAMHDDLLDAKAWAVEQGIAKADQVAIMGGSYGGYATLAGLTMTPEAFSCGVSIVGPSNLQTLMASIPPYWESFRQVFARAIGDPQTEQGLALLQERSPLTYVEQIKRPLLIAQGANDPRVKQAESDQIVEAMVAKRIPVTYLLYPDEGHGFARPENNISFVAVAENFLARCNGGYAEPVGQDFAGSSIQILQGAEFLPDPLRTVITSAR
ncbi:S9 family peptidase [Ferrimonas marina]|uniref:Dipeptidyl aminopeptidase/acylaminoacyl peptidase n=1 Tax=Ferrimonas marina TaxID=299255 RepID=A0A1M5ME33_9GAMM|nr:S9 family peptidase [Ferrimonas marina]SHG75598.1 Dipeptidyl aminopeptidase/acylaminoacyl peptidase [Ferrimonas marina]